VPYDEELAARVRQVLRRRTDITERKMFGGLAFLRHGKMCCGIVGQDLMVRVVEEDMPLAKLLRSRFMRSPSNAAKSHRSRASAFRRFD
jgi:TfoX/Sxy family transcriptional regulator of competence genes